MGHDTNATRTFGDNLSANAPSLTTPTSRDRFDIYYTVRSDGQAHTSEVNLDNMPTCDLLCAKDHPALHADVRKYAKDALEARDCRCGGYVDDALRIERKLDTMYDALPQALRW